MPADRPIVATDLPAVSEVLIHERNALLAEPGDKESLADGINRLLSDDELSARLSATVSEDVLSYTWDQRAANILGYIDDLQSGR
jgi:glycosyltransferase involved in cell wall biosynthesis